MTSLNWIKLIHLFIYQFIFFSSRAFKFHIPLRRKFHKITKIKTKNSNSSSFKKNQSKWDWWLYAKPQLYDIRLSLTLLLTFTKNINIFEKKKTVIVIVSFDFSDFFFKDRLLINIVLTENGFEYDKFDLLILLNKFALQGSSYFNKWIESNKIECLQQNWDKQICQNFHQIYIFWLHDLIKLKQTLTIVVLIL